jgi:hypothetical protein
VLYGDWISGNLAVTKIIPARDPNNSIYMAQDPQYIKLVIAPSQTSGNPIVAQYAAYFSRSNICDISQITSVDTFVQKCGKEQSATGHYLIKQA